MVVSNYLSRSDFLLFTFEVLIQAILEFQDFKLSTADFPFVTFKSTVLVRPLEPREFETRDIVIARAIGTWDW